MDSFVADVVMGHVLTMTLDALFEAKQDIAREVKERLTKAMQDFGFHIIQVLVIDIDPGPMVKQAMNVINESRRLRMAAEEKAEADKIARVKWAEAEKILSVQRAEAEAESRLLQGQGIARSRQAVPDAILSIMAARAGARQVFAVEATDMAERARKIVEGNGLSGVIRVIQGTVDTISLPCEVDVLVSQWMGYFLLRESMLDRVLAARDRFLKPGGSMFPSHATPYLAPLVKVKAIAEKWATWEQQEQHWAKFTSAMNNWYETDFSSVRRVFLDEQRKCDRQSSAFVTLTPKHLAGPGRPLLALDLLRTTLEQLRTPTEPLSCAMRIVRDGKVDGFTRTSRMLGRAYGGCTGGMWFRACAPRWLSSSCRSPR